MDAALDETGDIASDFERLSAPLAAVAQRVRLRIEGHRNDWPFDLDAGMPYAAWRQQKPPRVDEIAALLRREIRATPGVLRVDDWSSDYDVNARRLSFACTIIAEDGAIGLEFEAIGAAGGTFLPSLSLFPGATPITP